MDFRYMQTGTSKQAAVKEKRTLAIKSWENYVKRSIK